jgi:hypothetical protein
MRWWSSRREEQRGDRRREARALLVQVAGRWGRDVIHLWDRGYANAAWLQEASFHALRFVLRWPARYHLYGPDGAEAKAWHLTRGKRAWGHGQLWDGRRRCWRAVGVLAVPVRQPSSAQPLWLVVARRGEGESPWYLLTTEPVHTFDDAWAVVTAYAHRWQIEGTWRFGKAELALESPRLWTQERRQKLLLLATLAYAFLLSLCAPALAPLLRAVLRHGCHRTGRRSRSTPAPLYRLRSALSRLWLAHPPPRGLFPYESPG